MRICNLFELRAPPTVGEVTLEESDEYFFSKADAGGKGDILREYHRDKFPELKSIKLQEELAVPSNTVLTARASMLRPVCSNMWMKAWDCYVDNGLFGLLDHISTYEERGTSTKILSKAATAILNGFYGVGVAYAFVRGFMFPQLQLSPEELCSRYSEVAKWKSGFVRALGWHPNTKKLAIALSNDSVVLFLRNSTTCPTLKHPSQVNVTCVAFRPFSGSQIAVGCENGLLIWSLAASITVKTPTCHSANVFLRGTLVSSIQWHPRGDMIALCSAQFGDIKLLIPSTGEITPLTTFDWLPSAHLLKWSRDGCRMFGASPNGNFTIWQGNPTWEPINYKSTIVTHAAWSYDGCHLLYCKKGETLVYYLGLNPLGEPRASEATERPIIDLTGHPDGIPGEVDLFEWDKHCQRLVISFKERSPLLAVFKTSVKPVFTIEPLGYIRGPCPAEAMKFCEDVSDGALLTVCWENGLVQHIPMYFEISAGEKSILLSRSAVLNLTGDLSDELKIFANNSLY